MMDDATSESDDVKPPQKLAPVDLMELTVRSSANDLAVFTADPRTDPKVDTNELTSRSPPLLPFPPPLRL